LAYLVIIDRILKELAEINLDPPPGCSAGPKTDDVYLWGASILGPEGTPYAGGVFFLDITFPEDFPYSPPKVSLFFSNSSDLWLTVGQQIKFRTRIYHCNINRKGEICLDILKDNWSPALTVSQVLLSIGALLADCNPADPLDGAIAQQFLENRELHSQTAREWTQRYAVHDASIV